MDGAGVIFIEIPTLDNKSRSVSPVSPKNNGFFDMLSRRLKIRNNDELYFTHGDEDTRSSSTESCSSTSVQFADRNDNKMNNNHNHNSPQNRNGLNSASDSSIDSMIDNMNPNTAIAATTITTATTNGLRVHRRSTSSLRRAIQNLSILSRSQSCSSTATTTTDKEPKIKKSTKKSQPPPQQKCILRQPISYTYLKGMSGLPTQRVPKSAVCCHYSMHQ